MQTILNISEQSERKARVRLEDTKLSKMLGILRARPSGLNRFEAEHFGDHCLHSTVSTLRKKGYTILDQWEWVGTRFGDVHVKRYWFVEEPIAAA